MTDVLISTDDYQLQIYCVTDILISTDDYRWDVDGTYMKNYVQNFVHPELSFVIIGTAYEAFNLLGPGYKEKYYRDLMHDLLIKAGKEVKKEYLIPLIIEGKRKDHYFDLFVEDKVLIELKIDARLRKDHFDQSFRYLTAAKKDLCILCVFTRKGVIPKRVVNLDLQSV